MKPAQNIPQNIPDDHARSENSRIEALWRSGAITFAAFDWWLRSVSGV